MQSVSWCSRFLYLRNLTPKLNGLYKVSNFYLRDNCQEKESFNVKSRQRIHTSLALDRNVKPLDVAISNDVVSINWSDNHTSNFNVKWFEKILSGIQNEYKLAQPWNVESIKTRNTSVDYHRVLSCPNEKYKFYNSLVLNGFVLVKNSPRSSQSMMEFSREIGSIKDSREYFDPESQYYTLSNENNHDDFDIAYTQGAIRLHTDNPDMAHPASLITLQIIEHSGIGGKSLLTDGMHCVEELEKNYPEAVNILSTYRVVYQQFNNGENYIFAAPVIEMDKQSGKLLSMRISESNRSPIQPFIPQENMDKWYDAWIKLNRYFYDSKNLLEMQLDFDTMMVMDNRRIVHGRTAFTGNRKIIGCYISHDTWKAKARKLNVF